MSPEHASSGPRPNVAARVVAWHNRHPLAQRIGVDDVNSIGLISLPHAAAASGSDAVATPPRWWIRLLRRDSASAPPLFSEDLIPEIGKRRLLAFAATHQFPAKPDGDDWPVRAAELDAELADKAQAAGLPDVADRWLITAAIERGSKRIRLLVGPGERPAIVGHRIWNRTRLGLCASATVAVVACGVLLPLYWPASGLPGVLAVAQGASASAPPLLRPAAAASVPTSAATTASRKAGADDPHTVVAKADVRPAPSEAVLQPALAETAASAAAPVPPVSATLGSSSPSTVHATAAAKGTASMPTSSPATEQASIIPNIRPDLRGKSSPPPASFHFALVSAPVQSQATAQATLKRLQAEAALIRHPIASQTTVHESDQGWRVSWWPFATERQAQNAQAAMADRRLRLEVVSF